MEITQYLEIMFNDSHNPCCLSDLETDNIVFMNQAMRKMLRSSQDYTKQKCYFVMQGKDQRCSFCPNDSLEFAKFHENYIYNEKLEQYFRVNHSLLEYHGKKYNMCKYFLAPSFQQQQNCFEDAMNRCKQIFKAEPHLQCELFLALLGEFYNCQRAYVHRYHKETGMISCDSLWRKDENAPDFPDLSSRISGERILDWFERRNELGIIEANSLTKDFVQGSTEDEVLRAFGLENVVLCDLGDPDAMPDRMVGLSNRKEIEFDYRLLKAVSSYIRHIGDPESLEKTYRHVNDRDFLTNFFTRDRYARQIHSYTQTPPSALGVLYVNINGLRKTNEFFGSAKGDKQIQSSAQLLTTHFKEEFYRISGDEFVAFFPEIEENEFALQVNLLRDLMKQQANISFTMGHAWKMGRFALEDLVLEAETLMYINKQRYYYTLSEEQVPSGKVLLDELLSHLRNREFMVYLQPQVDLLTSEVVGAEALIRRFDKKKQKMVFPDQFIPLYEQESIIRHVDMFVLEEVCKLLVQWKKIGKAIPVSVNLSRVTLLEHGIVDSIALICEQYQVEHRYIIIEVTERVGLIENEVASSLVSDFMSRGFKISLDDFGCAYSNIITLVKVSVDEVKIDKSLVDDLTISEKNQIIIENMLKMCNSFQHTHTLAEGIEDAKQAEILRDFGCSYGQGYFYSRPIPSQEFTEKYICDSAV